MRPSLAVFLFPALAFTLGLTACQRGGTAVEEARVKAAFQSCQTALMNHQTDEAMTYFSRNTYDYLNKLNTSPNAVTVDPAAAQSDTPGVNLLLRTALEKKVPADLRPTLTLDRLMQRITDRRLLNLRDVEAISLGGVTINGDRASAGISYKGGLTALHMPFVKENNNWKIDLMAILPYAELLMRVDRAVKGQSEAQQVDQLVSKLPSL